jgi:hypothetical protein
MSSGLDLVRALERIRRETPVTHAYLTYGRYDFVAIVKATDLNEVSLLVRDIRRDGAIDTVTQIAGGAHVGINFVKPGRERDPVSAFILVKMGAFKSLRSLKTELMSIEPIAEAHSVFGVADIMLCAKKTSYDTFFNQVFVPLRGLARFGISSSSTLLTVEPQPQKSASG